MMFGWSYTEMFKKFDGVTYQYAQNIDLVNECFKVLHLFLLDCFDGVFDLRGSILGEINKSEPTRC